MAGKEISEQQQAADIEARRIMCEPVINAVLRMFEDRIQLLMERSNIGWEEAANILMSEIESEAIQ